MPPFDPNPFPWWARSPAIEIVVVLAIIGVLLAALVRP